MAGHSRAGLAAAIACIGLLAACSGPKTASPGSPSTTDPASTPVAPSARPTQSAATLDGLVVLADGVQGGIGLWTYGQSGWASTQPIPHASAIASASGGIAVANGQTVETRAGSDLGKVTSTVTLQWPGSAPTNGVVAFSLASGGRLALVADEDNVSYATAGADGEVGDVAPAASQPFTPLIAWLDTERVVVMSTDARQVSRVAVGRSPQDFSDLPGLIGCRWFAVSGDGGSIAAGTDSGVYVAAAQTWLSGGTPGKIANLEPGVVVWAMALDRSGSRLAYLAGSVSADGTVTSAHEIVYSSGSGSWQQVADLTVPFSKALGQAWAG